TGDDTTMVLDSVMAVSMIILNLVVAMCLVIYGLRYVNLPVNRVGTAAYLVMLAVMITTGFALPAVIGTDGVLGSGQAMVVATLAIGLYAVVLWRQTRAQAADFREAPGMPPSAARPGQGGTDAEAPRRPIGEGVAEHPSELLARPALLVATLLPIVLLAQHMATLLDDGLGRLGAPVALAGVRIALIVFPSETLTAV